MTTTDHADDAPGRRSFSDFVADHKRGAVDDDATAQFADLLELVRLHEKPGSFTFKVVITPSDDGVIITTQLSTTTPKPPAVGQFYFHGDDGMPARRDPRQPVLDQWPTAAANTDAADKADERTPR